MTASSVKFRFDVITLFPDFFHGLRTLGLIGRAVEEGRLEIVAHDLREFGLGRYRQVDDRAYGGGVGVVLRPEPVVAAIEQAVTGDRSRVLLLSPQGKLWNQARARACVRECDQLVLVCGRYEGIDERVALHFVDEEISVGDYVLMGGEAAAWVVIESVARLVPGVVGNPDSLRMESFECGLLDSPQYTRPWSFRGHRVPRILRSGHHAAVEYWRRLQALKKTLMNRPDLLAPRFRESDRDLPGLAWLQDWISWLEKYYNKIYQGVGEPEDKHARTDAEAPAEETPSGSP